MSAGCSTEEEQLKEINRRLTLVAREDLRRWAERASSRRIPQRPRSRCPEKIQGRFSVTAVWGTPYCRALIESSCGDGCYNEYALYDTRGKRVRVPFDPSSRLLVSPSGRRVIAGNSISDWRQILITEGAAGWIGFGYVFDAG